tara:strand:+ start:2390 stop:3070 length:681 start_codon:yes stop_codon:yes gene_type:complete
MTFPFPVYSPLKLSVASVSFASTNEDEVNRTNYTFSSQGIGTAAADRKVVVVINASGAGTNDITGCTIGGSAATEEQSSGLQGEARNAIYSLNSVSSGTTADIVVTQSGNAGVIMIAVFAVYGASATKNASGTQKGNAISPSISLAVPANGVIIAGSCAAYSSGSASNSMTFTNITERVEYLGDSNGFVAGAASDAYENAATISVDSAFNGSNAATVSCAVSYGPA